MPLRMRRASTQGNAARFVQEHRLDDAHSLLLSSYRMMRGSSLIMATRDAINSEPPFPKLPANRT